MKKVLGLVLALAFPVAAIAQQSYRLIQRMRCLISEPRWVHTCPPVCGKGYGAPVRLCCRRLCCSRLWRPERARLKSRCSLRGWRLVRVALSTGRLRPRGRTRNQGQAAAPDAAATARRQVARRP